MALKPDTAWFRRKLEEHRLSQSGLGRMLDIDKASMSLLLSGKRKLSLEHAAGIARILGVTASEVIERMGVSMQGIRANKSEGVQSLPLEGWIDASAKVHSAPRKKAALDIGLPVEAGAQAFQWRTLQTRMDILDGWIVVAGATREPDEAMIDRVCVVGVKGGDRLLRTVRRGHVAGSHTLLGIEVADATEAEIEWYAPILFAKPANV